MNHSQVVLFIITGFNRSFLHRPFSKRMVLRLRLVEQLFAALNRMVELDIKQSRTKGFQYINSRRVRCGSEHAFRLPLGLASGDVERYADALVAAVGAPVEVIDRSGAVIIRVVETDFPPEIPYKPADFRSDRLLIGYNRLLQPIYLPLKTFLLVGGAPNSGKTDWLRWMVYQLIKQRYLVYIVDLKGISFFPFELIPGVSVFDNLKDARDCLEFLTIELDRRKALIKQTRNRSLTEKMQKIAFIGDEAAVFSPNQHSGAMKALAYECEHMIAYLSQQGREFKMFGIMAYQRPDERTVNKQFKANVEASICFRTKDGTNSRIILDQEGAEKISPTTPGRCIFSYDRSYILQTPFIGGDDSWETLLQPFRMEVLQHGKSNRTESPRTVVEGSFECAGSDDKATLHSQSVLGPDQESKFDSTGTRAGEAGQLAVSRQREGMEFNPVRPNAHELYSDEIE